MGGCPDTLDTTWVRHHSLGSAGLSETRFDSQPISHTINAPPIDLTRK